MNYWVSISEQRRSALHELERTGRFDELVAEAEGYLQAERERDIVDVHFACALEDVGLAHLRQDCTSSAISFLRAALDAYSQVDGQRSQSVARCLNKLAMAEIRNKADASVVEALASQALEIIRSLPESEQAGGSKSLALLARVAMRRRQFAEAEALLIEAMQWRKRVFGDGSPKFAETFADLCRVYRLRGDLDSARKAIRKAIRGWQLSEGEEGFEYGGLLSLAGHVFRESGQTAAAVAYFREAVAVLSAALPEEHGELGRVRSALANAVGDP